MDKIIWFFKNFTTIRFGWWDTAIFNQGGQEVYDTIALFWILFCGIYLFFSVLNYIVMVNDNNSRSEWTLRAVFILIRYLITNAILITLVFMFGLSIGGPVGLTIVGVIFLVASIFEAVRDDEIAEGLFGFLGRAKSEGEDYNRWMFKINGWKREYEDKRIKI